MLLIKVGLHEDEANKFIYRLGGELSEGALKQENDRLKFVERELARLEVNQSRAPNGSGHLRTVLISVASGVAANFLTDAIKYYGNPIVLPPPQNHATDQSQSDFIQIEWAGSRLMTATGPFDLTEMYKVEELLRRGLQIHEGCNGTLNPKTAAYLDGIGLILDLRRRHQKAERMRRQAIKISQSINGADHESTGAALSNLGLCLFSQRKYTESNQFLAMAFKILVNRLGMDHPTVAGAVYNCYFCLNAQGHLANVKMPVEFLDGLPQLLDTANSLLGLKLVRVTLIAALDVMWEVQLAMKHL
jgi:tetratricopeptide (TPR) repeat protein